MTKNCGYNFRKMLQGTQQNTIDDCQRLLFLLFSTCNTQEIKSGSHSRRLCRGVFGNPKEGVLSSLLATCLGNQPCSARKGISFSFELEQFLALRCASEKKCMGVDVHNHLCGCCLWQFLKTHSWCVTSPQTTSASGNIRAADHRCCRLALGGGSSVAILSAQKVNLTWFLGVRVKLGVRPQNGGVSFCLHPEKGTLNKTASAARFSQTALTPRPSPASGGNPHTPRARRTRASARPRGEADSLNASCDFDSRRPAA